MSQAIALCGGRHPVFDFCCFEFAAHPPGRDQSSPSNQGIYRVKFVTLTSVAVLAIATGALQAQAQNAFATDSLTQFEQMEYDAPVASDFTSGATPIAPLLAASIGSQRQLSSFTPSGAVVKSFQGISQYDVASYGRNFIPPDTMGAVGATQFTEFANGGFAVFGKDGVVQTATSDVAFWAAAGQTGANGDSRVLFDASANRWIALSFGASVSDIQIAVSNTADATGGWRSTKFTGFAGGTADYPTLAIDNNAVYIGTNNFNGAGQFNGTTMNVIPLSSLLGGAAPTTAGIKSFNNPYDPATGGVPSAYVGYAMQGVNSTSAGTTGKVVAESLYYYTDIAYDIKDVGTVAATLANGNYLNNTAFTDPTGPARQPNAIPDLPTAGSAFTSNDRVVDNLDARIGSSVYEANGKIYSVQTVSDDASDTSKVRLTVINAATNTILSETDIGDGVHDFYQGSLSINNSGQVVVGYNRSGSGADGRISVFAQAFGTDASGNLYTRGGAQLLQVSLVDDYHNGSIDGFVAAGRQRWGDYSQVTLDPTDPTKFWVIGEYAREYNDAAGGHIGGTGGSRWSTWISEIDTTAVPEPSSWALMLTGFGLIGGAMRRRQRAVVA